MHIEIFAFDPYFGGASDFVEDDAATIGWRDCDRGIISRGTGASFWFEFAVKELVESTISAKIKSVTF